MKFYRLSKVSLVDGHIGFEWFTNQRDVHAAYRDYLGNFKDEERVTDCDGTEIEIIEIEPTKQGILRALNHYADHADNG